LDIDALKLEQNLALHLLETHLGGSNPILNRISGKVKDYGYCS